MSLDAMKQALEALEQLQGGCTDSDDGTVEVITVWCPEVITTLRAAIEHAERPMTHSADCWRWHHACARAWIERNKHKADGKEVLASTAPCQWQGLTDEDLDIRALWDVLAGMKNADGSIVVQFARAIEAKLKEKNG